MTAQVDARTRRRTAAAAGALVLLALLGLWWAKYGPYTDKVPAVLGSGELGASIVAGDDAVSMAAGWDFAVTYLGAVWKALVVGLVLAAAVQVLLPAGWLGRVLGRAGGLRGALASVPTLMCSCCAAPLAVGLRRARVPVPAALAFWLGNPALNPVVLVFCLAVLPWPWAVLRLAGGAAVVVVAVLVAQRVAGRREAVPVDDVAVEPAPDPRPLPVRFATTLGGTALRLLPEYAVVVLLLGTFRGVLFPVDAGPTAGVAVVLLLCLAGLALPVPTGAEVAVVAAALAAGLAAPAAAVLLVALPVLSLPSLLMVRTVFPARVLAGTTAAAGGVALLGAAVVAAV